MSKKSKKKSKKSKKAQMWHDANEDADWWNENENENFDGLDENGDRWHDAEDQDYGSESNNLDDSTVDTDEEENNGSVCLFSILCLSSCFLLILLGLGASCWWFNAADEFEAEHRNGRRRTAKKTSKKKATKSKSKAAAEPISNISLNVATTPEDDLTSDLKENLSLDNADRDARGGGKAAASQKGSESEKKRKDDIKKKEDEARKLKDKKYGFPKLQNSSIGDHGVQESDLNDTIPSGSAAAVASPATPVTLPSEPKAQPAVPVLLPKPGAVLDPRPGGPTGQTPAALQETDEVSLPDESSENPSSTPDEGLQNPTQSEAAQQVPHSNGINAFQLPTPVQMPTQTPTNSMPVTVPENPLPKPTPTPPLVQTAPAQAAKRKHDWISNEIFDSLRIKKEVTESSLLKLVLDHVGCSNIIDCCKGRTEGGFLVCAELKVGADPEKADSDGIFLRVDNSAPLRLGRNLDKYDAHYYYFKYDSRKLPKYEYLLSTCGVRREPRKKHTDSNKYVVKMYPPYYRDRVQREMEVADYLTYNRLRRSHYLLTIQAFSRLSDTTEGAHYTSVSDYAGIRDMKTLVNGRPENRDLSVLLPVLRDVSYGVGELHSFGLIHRDLRANNMVVSVENKGETTQRARGQILDYSCGIWETNPARTSPENRYQYTHFYGIHLSKGPLECLAPAYFHPWEEGKKLENFFLPNFFVTAGADSLTFGITTLELLTGWNPVHGDEKSLRNEIIEEILKKDAGRRENIVFEKHKQWVTGSDRPFTESAALRPLIRLALRCADFQNAERPVFYRKQPTDIVDANLFSVANPNPTVIPEFLDQLVKLHEGQGGNPETQLQPIRGFENIQLSREIAGKKEAEHERALKGEEEEDKSILGTLQEWFK